MGRSLELCVKEPVDSSNEFNLELSTKQVFNAAFELCVLLEVDEILNVEAHVERLVHRPDLVAGEVLEGVKCVVVVAWPHLGRGGVGMSGEKKKRFSTDACFWACRC